MIDAYNQTIYIDREVYTMATCPRCGKPMTGGICNNCGFPMNRHKTMITITIPSIHKINQTGMPSYLNERVV